jgi:hypothetical protein
MPFIEALRQLSFSLGIAGFSIVISVFTFYVMSFFGANAPDLCFTFFGNKNNRIFSGY